MRFTLVMRAATFLFFILAVANPFAIKAMQIPSPEEDSSLEMNKTTLNFTHLLPVDKEISLRSFYCQNIQGNWVLKGVQNVDEKSEGGRFLRTKGFIRMADQSWTNMACLGAQLLTSREWLLTALHEEAAALENQPN